MCSLTSTTHYVGRSTSVSRLWGCRCLPLSSVRRCLSTPRFIRPSRSVCHSPRCYGLHLLSISSFILFSSVTPTLSFRLDCLQVFLIFLLIPPPSLSRYHPSLLSSPLLTATILHSAPSRLGRPQRERELCCLLSFCLSLTNTNAFTHSVPGD